MRTLPLAPPQGGHRSLHMLTEGWNFNGVMARQHSESVQRYGSSATGRPQSQKFHERQSLSKPASVMHCSLLSTTFLPPLGFGFQGTFYIVLGRTLGLILVHRVFSMVCVSEPMTCNTRVVAGTDFASRAGGCCSVTLFAIL